MYNYLINNIIPADDLHYCDEEKKYVSLSREEIDDVMMTCIDQDMKNIDDIYKVIQWCGNIRVGQLLWKNFLLGSLNISGFDDLGEPIFSPNKKGKLK